jgi:hypothetical protein
MLSAQRPLHTQAKNLRVADWPLITYRVAHLLISWDSLGHWIFRVAQNCRYRQVTLSEPEAQPEMDGHAVLISAVKSVGKTATSPDL